MPGRVERLADVLLEVGGADGRQRDAGLAQDLLEVVQALDGAGAVGQVGAHGREDHDARHVGLLDGGGDGVGCLALEAVEVCDVEAGGQEGEEALGALQRSDEARLVLERPDGDLGPALGPLCPLLRVADDNLDLLALGQEPAGDDGANVTGDTCDDEHGDLLGFTTRCDVGRRWALGPQAQGRAPPKGPPRRSAPTGGNAGRACGISPCERFSVRAPLRLPSANRSVAPSWATKKMRFS